MVLLPQAVYLAIDFVFETGNNPPKRKYFVVLHCDEESYLLVSLTTSISKLPESLDVPGHGGCVHFNDNRGYGHCYVILSTDVIGINSYSFSAPKTYIQWEMKAQVKIVTQEKLSEQITRKVEQCCMLTDEIYKNILTCLLKSKFISKKHRLQIQERVKSI
jgi:hypothetical protein